MTVWHFNKFNMAKKKGVFAENIEDEEPNFSDPEDFVDTISDQEELLEDILKQKPKEVNGIESVIIIDNVPQVGPERLEKLQNIVRKLFTKFGTIVNECYPVQDGATKGFIFLEFKNREEAQRAVAATNCYKLDKQHVFAVNLMTDAEKYMNIADNWEEPTAMPYKDTGNLYYWLLNPNSYDHFCVIHDGGESTSLFLNSTGEPQCLETRKKWTETYIKWTPLGTYLLTFHQRGIALWGGEKMGQIMKFSQPGVQMADFSPCEKYVVTYSSTADNKDEPQDIIIWDMRTGAKKRGFHCDNPNPWPVFKWSHDGKYFARMTPDALSIYETPSFGLIGKKSLKIKGLRDFSWSPTDHIIAYWTGEERDTPARVMLIELPSAKVICTKNLFAVVDCHMHWQKSGSYLCVKADRYKNKKEKDGIKYSGLSYSFNIFRIREKIIPVDTVEVKDSISAFAWEPVGHRFACIHGESPRTCVTFYNVNPGGKVEPIKTLEKRIVNHLFWSPNGQFIVLAGLRNLNGVLEFVDTNDMSVMMQAEHFMATDVEWDPTGRYVMTGVSWWSHKVDNAFWIWSFQGKILHKQVIDRNCQFLWRPRPPTLLSEERQTEIKKDLKKYSIQFSMDDKKRQSKASKEQTERRRKLQSEHERWQMEVEERRADDKKRRLKLRGGVDTDEFDNHVDNYEEEVVEFLVDVREFILDE